MTTHIFKGTTILNFEKASRNSRSLSNRRNYWNSLTKEAKAAINERYYHAVTNNGKRVQLFTNDDTKSGEKEEPKDDEQQQQQQQQPKPEVNGAKKGKKPNKGKFVENFAGSSFEHAKEKSLKKEKEAEAVAATKEVKNLSKNGQPTVEVKPKPLSKKEKKALKKAEKELKKQQAAIQETDKKSQGESKECPKKEPKKSVPKKGGEPEKLVSCQNQVKASETSKNAKSSKKQK